MGQKSKYINLLKNMGIFALSNFSIKIITFVVLPLYTYYLTTDEYAVIDLVNSTVQLLLPFLSLCMTDAVLRFGISKEHDIKQVFSSGLTIVLLGTCFLIITLFLLSRTIDLNGIQVFFAAIYLLQALNSLFSAFYKAIDKVKEMAIITMLSSLLVVVFNILFIAVLKAGMEGYLTSVILGNTVGCIAYFIYGKLYRFYRFCFVKKAILKEMLQYAVPLIPNAVFWWISTSLDRYALMILTSLSVVGLYSVANKIPIIISTMTSIFSQAWNLSAFQAYDDDGREMFYRTTYRIYQGVMIVCTSFIVICCRPLSDVLFSKGFYDAWVFVPVLSIAVYYNSMNSFLGSIFTASKKTKYIFYTTGLGALVNAIMNIVLIIAIGPHGAAIATLISHITVFIIRTIKTSKIVNLQINYINEVINLVILTVLCALIVCGKNIGTILAIAIFLMILLLNGKKIVNMKKS